jgi:hypothetical protein
MNARTNTTLDDISGEIGFSAAITLAVWYGGRNLYVPAEPDEGMAVAKLVGMPAARRLCEEWGGSTLAVPTMWRYEEEQRNRTIGNLLIEGKGTKEIAAIMGMTERRIQQIRRALEDAGMLPMVLGKNGAEKPA